MGIEEYLAKQAVSQLFANILRRVRQTKINVEPP